MVQEIDRGLERATEIIKEIDFPTLPLYLQMIQKEMSHPFPSFPKIAGLVSQDMALTAKLLRTVNSVAFKTKSHIDNVLQALTVLGLENFYTSVLAESLRSALENHALSADNFAVIWQHSTEIARACKFLAELISKSVDCGVQVNANHAYLAGLFHDCGIPVMAARFPDYERSAQEATATGETLTAMESRLFTTDHSILCYLIGKMWKLPDSVVFAMYGHESEDLGYCGETENRELGTILRYS